jgi:hypothetical protein
MLNDYKPTCDPNVDTFKVEYLLGSSALLAILFPQKYTFPEVGSPILYFLPGLPRFLPYLDLTLIDEAKRILESFLVLFMGIVMLIASCT